MQPDYQARQAKLRDISGVDAIAIVPGANLLYFTGLRIHLMVRPFIALFNADGMACIIPELDVPSLQARPDLNARLFMWKDKDGFLEAFRAAVDTLGLRGGTLGIDGMTMRASEWLTFAGIDPTLKVKPVERDLLKIRSRKDAVEIDAMRRAVKISEEALANLLTWVQPGMTERQIANRLSQDMTARGGQGEAFGPLVQTGPNSANPHGNTTDRALQADEFLLIDFGCKVDDYPADITRTFCLGTPTTEMQKIYDTVLRANEAAKAVVKPGVAWGAVDKAARDVIAEAGYGQYFIHRTGHGLGLDLHEPVPNIIADAPELLEAGMTFTIEPGIYVPELGGVRVEDNVVVTETGVDVLTSFPRKLRV